MFSFVKRLSVEFGLYSHARRISRFVRTDERHRFQQLQNLYRHILGPESRLCFDIGANIGELSEAMLAQGHTVVSFEPNDDLAPELRARCGKYPKWFYCLSAMGSSPGIATLHVRDFIGQASLRPNWGSGDIRSKKNAAVVTLDMAIEYFGAPSFVKIDTEGHDVEVIGGLRTPVEIIVFEIQVSDDLLVDAYKCLEKISLLGEYECNLVDGYSLELVWDKWVPLDQLKDSLRSGRLTGVPIRAAFGDVYCRRIGPDHPIRR